MKTENNSNLQVYYEIYLAILALLITAAYWKLITRTSDGHDR